MMTPLPTLPLLGFAAYSGTGKTTLLEALLPTLTQSGLRVGVLKHAHHDFDVDKPGKDSYRLRKAGANQMLIASRNRHVLMTETPEAEAEFFYLLSRFDSETLDLILVEGCKNIAFPKIELHRDEVGKPWLHPHDSNIIAIASNVDAQSSLPQIDINDHQAIINFIIDYAKQYKGNDASLSALPCSHTSQGNVAAVSQSDIASACCDSFSPASLSVVQGVEKILDSVNEVSGFESVNLLDSLDRVLAKDVTSPVNVPQYTNSAMDGFAIRSDDLERDEYAIISEVMAGYSYDKPLELGQAVKIMTGAPTPSNGETVIMREQATEIKGLQGICDNVTFSGAKITRGQNVRQAGEDLKHGSAVFDAGTRIASAETGMLASLGFDSCLVKRKVKVAVFSTGDEVQAPGTEQRSNSIFDSNRFTIMSMLKKLNCDVLDFGIIEDDEEKMIMAIKIASEQADLVITSGGVSVGDADFIKTALEKLGSINFWRINMRPGRPLAFGQVDFKPFFGLPGNPVAVMVSFINFVEPAVRKMQGQLNWTPLKVSAVATVPLRSRLGRTEFSRGVHYINEHGQLVVRTTGKQGSGILRSMSEATCLIEISPSVDTVKVGQNVTIIPLQGRI